MALLLSCVQEMEICFYGAATNTASWPAQNLSCVLPLPWTARCWAEKKLYMCGAGGRILLLKQVKQNSMMCQSCFKMQLWGLNKVIWLFSASGRVFTWGRGSYGQLGRRSANQEPADSAVGVGDKKCCLPAEVKSLNGATQVTLLFVSEIYDHSVFCRLHHTDSYCCCRQYRVLKEKSS